jgi:hypothetical protein
MAKVKTTGQKTTRDIRPALNPDAEESLMIALATELVKQRLLDGTASSQETTHFLKLGSSRARLENKRIEHEIKLMETKRKSLEDTEEIKVLYEDALKAMRNYAGQGDPDEY